MKTTLNVLFKKIQKDDKKEILEFHVQGDELPNSQELIEMAGNIVVLEIKGNEAGKINAEYKSIQRDSKKTALKFNIKGDSEDKVIKLYKQAGGNVTLFIEPSQMSIDEFYGDDNYEENVNNANKEDSVQANEGQLSLDEIEDEADILN
jgi:hypothetical protein